MTIKTRKIKILSSHSVVPVIQQILKYENEIDRDKEHIWCVGLDVRNRIKYIELVSLGILSSAVAHPREIFRFAITQAVASIILCHNHPSGDTTPSDIDIELTKRLRSAGELLGIELLDHIIITDKSFYSFHDDGRF